MIVKQKVITEKQFLRPEEVSEKEWVNHWKKYSDGLPDSDDDFYKYHMEDSSSDIEVLETIPASEVKDPSPIEDRKKKTNGVSIK